MALFKASRKTSEGSSAGPEVSPSPDSSSSQSSKPATKSRGAEPTGPAESPGKGPLGTALADVRGKRYPYVLLFSIASWLVVAIILFFSQVGTPETTIDNASEAAVQGTGGQIAPTAQDQWFVPLLPWFGIVVIIAAVALFVGIGWARLVLAVLGLLMAVGLAEAQEQMQAVLVALFTVIGVVLSLLLPSHRYLNGTSAAAVDGPSDGPAEPDQTTTGRTII